MVMSSKNADFIGIYRELRQNKRLLLCCKIHLKLWREIRKKFGDAIPGAIAWYEILSSLTFIG
jgi:hypothetical protein